MRQIFFSKDCANTETHSFGDIYAIRVFEIFSIRNFFTGTTLIGTSMLQTLISPCHKYWMPDLEKFRKIINPQKLCYIGYEISANYLFFLDIKLDRNKIISNFCSPKLNEQNQACVKITYRCRWSNQKLNKFAGLILHISSMFKSNIYNSTSNS